MQTIKITTITVTALAAIAVGAAAPVSGAPSGSGSVQDTVNSLQADGYRVILNKTGSAPLAQCTLTAIRPGQQFTPYTTRDENGVVAHSFSTIYVDATC
ncbi:MAG: hypothetical protein JO152_00590 [Mycobacteriaceae bacterium]|nr:hypothetical protein [Mycobacteriaceae bacterium]